MAKTAEELDGTSVPLTEVLDESFFSANTSYQNFDSLIEASGFKVEYQKDFDNIPEEEWNKFIIENSNFASWQDMIDSAGAIYAKKKFGL